MTTNTIPTMTEEAVRDLIALLTKHPDLRMIEKIYGDRVEERHIAGEQFDVVISNGDHILLEITARFKSHDFHKMERKRTLYTTHVQAPARFIVAAASIHSRQARKLEEAGYELVEPEDDI